MNELVDDSYILVVEDSRVQASVLERKLSQAGFQVRVAEDGVVGLELIRQRHPRLVISDIEMPNMTGYELCAAVKNDPHLRTIPFILLSTLKDAQDIVKGLHCGADNYVTKPYQPEYLISRVESLLSTPVDVSEEDERTLDVNIGGNKYTVKVGRQQVLNLLVSTFENAVQKNVELIQANESLAAAKNQLDQWNRELESLNAELESVNSRMSRDLQAAAKVQQSLLPTGPLDIPNLTVDWKYLPCDELAGDFLNFFPLDEQHVAAYVVDVSGHGVASSLLSVTIGQLLKPQVSSSSLLVQAVPGTDKRRIVPPAEVAAELNRRFPMEEQNGLYFTMLYGVLDIDSLEFRYISAGHDPIVHVPSLGSPQCIEQNDTPIGWFEDIEFEDQVLQLSPGDRIYLYSDGVPEAMDAEMNQFSIKQMVEIIELGQSQDLSQSVDLLFKTVQRWCAANGPLDDVSILGLQVASH
jgi:sigma-B regulation protein RsbU (phosphoserine phosphatase)